MGPANSKECPKQLCPDATFPIMSDNIIVDKLDENGNAFKFEINFLQKKDICILA